MAQETAVMQLLRFILVERRQENGSIQFHIHEDFGKFLRIEKEQIIDAANQNQFEDVDGLGICDTITKGEQYYNETYGNKKVYY